jgi:predicted nuclease with TOPRIM domain
MTSNEQMIATFQTRVRDLLHRFQELKKENAELYTMIEKNEQNIKVLQARLSQADRDYFNLKMAKMMEITDGDLDSAKARVAKLIREVNKCIAILSDEQE